MNDSLLHALLSCFIILTLYHVLLLYSIPPIALTEGGQEEDSPSYGSLRESQLAGRFLDGPSSYRDKTSGQIKTWRHQKVRFQSSSEKSGTPGERMKEMRDQQDTPNSNSSSLSAIMSSQEASASFVDHEYSLQQDNILSTSLTGLELLQRGLSVDDRPPDASHLSSWSSSGANTYDAVAEQPSPLDDANLSLDQSTNNNNNMSPLPDDDEDDDGPVFDLDME